MQNQQIARLMSSQRILEHLNPSDDFLQLVVIILMATTYYSLGEFRRAIRYLESWEEFIEKFSLEEISFKAKRWQIHLHIIALLGECLLAEGNF